MTQIRPATPADAPTISKLLHDSFVEYEPLYTHEGFAATTPTDDHIRERMLEGPIWVAVQDNVIVGTVSAVVKGDGLYVRGMAVHPSARGQRIGEVLLQHVENFALSTGCRYMFLSTTPFLARAIRLYKHFGFQRTDDGPKDLFGTPLFTMVKDLATPQATPTF